MLDEDGTIPYSDIDILDAIAAHEAQGGEPVSRLGYFCAPFRPSAGPLLGKVVKVYRVPASEAVLRRLEQAHEQYVEILTDCGVRLPETAFHLVEMEGAPVPVIVQQALPAETMMRGQMVGGPLEDVMPLMHAAGDVIATFWAAAAHRSERVGFHPSIRNLAVVDGQGVFFDTFPPLVGYSREEMGQVLITFSGAPWMRRLGPLMRGRVTAIQDEWYSPAETFTGLVGSACRLRPADAEAFLGWGRDFARRRMPDHADEILAELQAPPRLPWLWTFIRSRLGQPGEPNI